MCGGMSSEETVVVDVEEPFFFRRTIRVPRFLVEGGAAALSVMVDGWG